MAHLKNREEKLKRHRLYYAAHKDKWKAYEKKYREENREKLYEKSKLYQSRHGDKYLGYHEKYRKANKEKIKARNMARYALTTGKIQKSEVCYDCKTKGYTEMHHENYSKPYVVVWLCRRCHRLRE